MKIEFKKADESDLQLLGEMNRKLIEDEEHLNPMSVSELSERMRKFIGAEYNAYIITVNGTPGGYCLYRDDFEYIYIRQLYVERNHRRKGLGSACVKWLSDSFWRNRKVRVEVLSHNHDGMAFWMKIGFIDYCITMELPG